MVIRGLLGELIMRVLCISPMPNWIVTSQRFLFNESSDNLVGGKKNNHHHLLSFPMKLFFLSPSGSYWAVPQHLQAALIGIHFLTLRMTSMISLMSEYLLLCMCGLRLSLCSSTKCECTAVVWAVNKDRCPWCVPKYNPLHFCVLFLEFS